MRAWNYSIDRSCITYAQRDQDCDHELGTGQTNGMWLQKELSERSLTWVAYPELSIRTSRGLTLHARHPISTPLERLLGLDCLRSLNQGAPEAAPFQAIHVGAAAEAVPEMLMAQLAVGGRMIVPVGPVMGPQVLMQVAVHNKPHRLDIDLKTVGRT